MNLEDPDHQRNAAVDTESPVEALEVRVHGARGDAHRFRNGSVVIVVRDVVGANFTSNTSDGLSITWQ